MKGKITKSMKQLKEDIDKDPVLFISEHTLVARLYYHLCNNISGVYKRIQLEYYLKNDEGLHIESDEDKRKQLWYECYKNNYPSNNPPVIAEEHHVGKIGRYDLVILNNKRNKIDHAFELKALSNDGFSPGSRHKLYEDIRILSQEILKGDRKSTFFLYLHSDNKHQDKVDEVAQKVMETYKNAKVTNVITYTSTVKKSWILLT